MLNNHVENQLEFTLKNVSEKDSLGNFIYKLKEFDPKTFVKKYGRSMVNATFFPTTPQDIFAAGKEIDTWVLETYKADRPTLKDYEMNDIVPPVLEKREAVPFTLLPAWDFLLGVNQNKWCNYQVLKTPLVGMEDLKITLFAGYKVESPFTHRDDVKIAELRLKGPMVQIDKLVRNIKC